MVVFAIPYCCTCHRCPPPLQHDENKIPLREVVAIAFKHRKCNCIAIYDKSFAWVNNTRNYVSF